MESKTKEHDLRAADVLNGGEIGDRQAFITKCCQMTECLGAEAGPFYKAGESYEIKNSQESF